MPLLIVSGMAIAVFLLSLMLSKKNKLAADKFLIGYLIFFVVSQGYFYLESTGAFSDRPWMLLGRGSFLLAGPLFFYYMHVLTTSKRLPLTITVLTLLPFTAYVLTFLYYNAFVFYQNETEIIHGVMYINGAVSVPWAIFVVLFLVTDPFYLLWFYMLLRDYKKRTSQALSNTERVNLDWLNKVFGLWLVIDLVLLPVGIFTVGHGGTWQVLQSVLLQAGYVAFIFMLGYYGFRQTAVFSDAPDVASGKLDTTDESADAAYARSGLDQQQATDHHTRLLVLMRERKPYLDGELSARALADQLHISVNHLSQVLNQLQKQNFFDFVNTYRVDEVKAKMADPAFSHFTLLAMALESGFNSKTAFNAAFKKFTGLTPSRYHSVLKNAKKEQPSQQSGSDVTARTL
ncbi:helix-turn-helix domain-containing protein [Chryseolinea lacunae]|uniref:AraC family transcriptional regulator n=1 Tax=Chryseolinea lacunae TaxID=2801331 RepID=A0ABS1KM13_9BACT|nr:helix-turn-helix domain-containing protein [Chryseolinea lacunae]MBL0740508.1 AraC family transcriptional regulator [Chryseolinea lacunae]